MIPEKLLNTLYCSASTDRHFLQKAITICCGHSFCRDCIKGLRNPIICPICNESNDFDVKKFKESLSITTQIETYVKDLFEIVQKNIDLLIDKYKENLNLVDDKIEVKIEFIREQIEIKIESIKIELDKIHEQLNARLDKEKANFKEEKTKGFNISLYETLKEELKHKLAKEENIDLPYFYDCEEKCRKLKQMCDELENYDARVKFDESAVELDTGLVGRLTIGGIQSLSNTRIMQHVKIPTSDTLFYSLCVLPNDTLLASDFEKSHLAIFDHKFNAVNSINRINNESFRPLGLTTNDVDRIYIVDNDKHRILMVDFEFKLLGMFGGSSGCGKLQLRYPHGVFFYNESIYVCDLGNNRVKKLSANLDYEETFTVGFQVRDIAITNNVACMRGANIDTIYFYNLPEFNLKISYDGHSGPICVYNSWFYEFDQRNQRFYCYNKEGIFDQKHEANSIFGPEQYHQYSTITVFQDKFVLSPQFKFILI